MADKRKNGPRLHGALIIVLLGLACASVFFGNLKKHQAQKTIGIDALIPKDFDGWHYSPVKTAIRDLYYQFINELFEGIFRNRNGDEMILTIEYGSDLRRKYELHLPDVCHRTRGDNVLILKPVTVRLEEQKSISIALMEWEYPKEHTRALCAYWLVVGGEQTSSVFRLKFQQFLTSLSNHFKDSLLVRLDIYYPRVPDIGTQQQSMKIIENFIKSLYRSLEKPQRRIIFGN